MKTKKYIVKQVSSRKMGGYAGMNDEAAKVFHFPNCKDHTIIVDKTLKGNYKQRTIKHEMIEEKIMEERGYPYWKAHKIATQYEYLTYPEIKKKFGVERKK